MLTSLTIICEAFRNSGDVVWFIFGSKTKPGMNSSPGKTLAKKEKHHPMKVLYTPVVTICI